MVNRTITSYTLIHYFSENGLNQLDLYIPFACKSINKHSAEIVSAKDLSDWFSDDYGLSKIYKGVFVSLLKKMVGKGILYAEKGCYYVVTEQLLNAIKSYKESDSSSSVEFLCNEVINFAKNTYGIDYAIDEMQDGIIKFIDKHDGDLLFEEEKLIQIKKKQTAKEANIKKLPFVLSKFIIWSKDNAHDSYALVKNIAKGYALSSLISMRGIENYIGKMNGVIIALDAPIIFNLLGLNEKANYEMSSELLDILKKQGCSFVIFRQHYQEVIQTFNSTIHLLYTKNYSLDKASRLLKYAVRNKISSSVLKTKLALLDSILEKWGITICDAPLSPNKYTEIDNGKLNELLLHRYQENCVDIDENRRKTIDNDIDAISYIYRIRGNNPASNLKNCSAILVTNNIALAYASKHPALSSISHSIPVCMTDVFLSTILWFCFPDSSDDINEKVLLSECYKNLTLSDDILHRFYAEIKEIEKITPISEEIMLNINTSQMVQKLLEEKTFNDSSLYTDQTTAEILHEIEINKNKKINTLSGKLDSHDAKFLFIAKFVAGVIIFAVWFGLVVLFYILKYIDYSNWTNIWKIVLNILSIIPTLWGLLSWFGIIKNKAFMLDFLTKKLYTIIKSWFDQ